MKHVAITRMCLGGAIIFGSNAAMATVITLQEGFGGYSGTLSAEISSGQADNASPGSGGSARVSVDGVRSSDRQITEGLIRFDDIFGADGVPSSGITIDSAWLQFWTKSFSSGPVEIYQMTTDWDDSVTWNSLGGDGLAGDIVAVADDSLGPIPDEALIAFDVTASVTAWANGAPNYGWGIANSNVDGWDFNTELYNGSAPLEDRRPLLTINYSRATQVPEPGTAVLLGLGLLAGRFMRRKARS